MLSAVLRFFLEYQWFVDFAVYSGGVYLSLREERGGGALCQWEEELRLRDRRTGQVAGVPQADVEALSCAARQAEGQEI